MTYGGSKDAADEQFLLPQFDEPNSIDRTSPALDKSSSSKNDNNNNNHKFHKYEDQNG